MKAYAHNSIPTHWIVDDGAQAYLVPAIPDGWRKRIKLANHMLIPWADPVQINRLHSLGLPAK